jgi:hypothetical protein
MSERSFQVSVGVPILGLEQTLAEDAITALYLGFLSRHPDEIGLAAKKADLARLGMRNGLRAIIDDFIGCDEFRKRLRSEWSYGELVEVTQDPDRIYTQVMSLGSHCITSYLLKSYGLKRYSAPFDWVFSSLAMVGHCIQEDFEHFLDRSFYEPVEKTSELNGRCEHRFYREKFGVDSVFNHSDPTRDANYAYLLRCVDRFRESMRSPSWKMFVAVAEDSDSVEADFESLRQALREKTRLFRLIVIAVRPPDVETGGFALSRLRHTDDSTLFRFNSRSAAGATGFANELDDRILADLIRSYRFDLTAVQR